MVDGDPEEARAHVRERAQAQIARRLPALGFALPGSITSRTSRCGNPRCVCHTDDTRHHGPYLTWTRKFENKTLTRALSNSSAIGPGSTNTDAYANSRRTSRSSPCVPPTGSSSGAYQTDGISLARRAERGTHFPRSSVIRHDTPTAFSQGHRAGEGLSSSRHHHLDVPSPLRRGVPCGCFQGLRRFRGLRREDRGSALPLRFNDAAGFASCYGPPSCSP
jgi:hypothetical protein